ncbi:hypothetical protein GX50_07061, partial [[Emmonsia] crescens]
MRFTAASVALFAGAALAMPGYQDGYPVDPYPQYPEHPQPTTVYSTKDVTITSCPPGGYCPGGPEPTGGYPAPTDEYPAEPQPTDTEIEPYPTGAYPHPTGGEPYPTEEPYPTGGEPYPT